MISFFWQQIIFYFCVFLFVAFTFYFLYKKIRQQIYDDFVTNKVKSGFYFLLDLSKNSLDPGAFNPVLLDTYRLEKNCEISQDYEWYITVTDSTSDSVPVVSLLKPDFSDVLIVNSNKLLRTQPINYNSGEELPNRGKWLLHRVGKGWSFQNVKTNLYLSFSDCNVSLKQTPDHTCVFLIKYSPQEKYE